MGLFSRTEEIDFIVARTSDSPIFLKTPIMRALAISVIAHGLIFALIQFKPAVQEVLPPGRFVELEFNDNKPKNSVQNVFKILRDVHTSRATKLRSRMASLKPADSQKKELELSDLLDVSKSTGAQSSPEKSGSNLTVEPHLESQAKSQPKSQLKSQFEEQLSQEPNYQRIYAYLEANISFSEAELRLAEVGDVAFDILLEGNGRLKRVHPLTETNRLVRMKVLKVIYELFRTPLPNFNQVQEIPLVLHINIRIQSQDPNAKIVAIPKVMGPHLTITKIKLDKNRFISLKNGPSDDGVRVMFDLVSIWSVLFPGKSVPAGDRIVVDIEYRKQEMVRECEVYQAEGGCLEAAKIEKAFGEIGAARQHLDLACARGLKEACDLRGSL